MDFEIEPEELQFLATHVFFPPQVPQQNDQSKERDRVLCDFLSHTANAYEEVNDDNINISLWSHVRKMLVELQRVEASNSMLAGTVSSQISQMSVGDVLVYFVRAQNAAIIVRKGEEETTFESFEVSPTCAEVLKTTGKLICTYPGPAIAVNNSIVHDAGFLAELSSFISQMTEENLDSQATAVKAGSKVVEPRDTASPRYITQFLTGILRGVGRPAEVHRINKRVNDDVLWKDAYLPWRRSSLWLIIRVALQTTLGASGDNTHYKHFMLYLMSTLLRLTARSSFHGDYLHSFRAKLSTRYYKLGDGVPQTITAHVLESLRVTGDVLAMRFSTIQAEHAASPRWAPTELNVEADTKLTLANSRPYILERLAATPVPRSATHFAPTSPPRVRDTHTGDFKTFDEIALHKAFKATDRCYTALADFETLVDDCADRWSSEYLHDEWACRKVGRCIQIYLAAAERAYKDRAEDISVMFLTVFELWVVLDKLVTAQLPLLLDYSPEIPVELFHHLLARHTRSLQRLGNIERYITGRHHSAYHGSVFSGTTNENSFAVRYFDQSQILRRLKDRIELDAATARSKVKDELETKNSRHQQLIQQASTYEHECQINRKGKRVPLAGITCMNCKLTSEAKEMKISLHEWPLPVGTHDAQATVFELQCPRPFQIWRSTTYYLLHDVCGGGLRSPSKFKAASPPMTLFRYSQLQAYGQVDDTHFSRITFASSTKSFLQAHYKQTSLPSTESRVCVNNGLTYRLHDSTNSEWANDFQGGCERVKELCSLGLPSDSPYTKIAFAVPGTTHTPNEVLAKQSECPADLSLHDFVAFGLLRSGGRLQWLNMLRELRCRVLSFGREEVHLLLAQALWHVGPLNAENKRDWHLDPEDEQFSLALLQELEDFLSSVEANWADSTAVKTVVAITTRITSAIGRHTLCMSRILMVLRHARLVVLRWIETILAEFNSIKDATELRSLKLRVCELAAICRSTFDIDDIHARNLLRSNDDATILLRCAVYLRDNAPSSQADIPLHLQRLLERDRRLSHRLQPFLCGCLNSQPELLDLTLKSILGDSNVTSRWQQLAAPNDQWFTVRCSISTVHLDILTGELLIDGKPVSRLPSVILNHPTYVRLFSEYILDVIPSDVVGMDFATRSPVAGHQVHFAMNQKSKNQKSNSLIIVSKNARGTFELIPHKVLSTDIPELLVTNYVHWMSRDSRGHAHIEFRPLERPWTASDDDWCLRVSLRDASMLRQGAHLVDGESATFRMVAQQLHNLEHPQHLIITSTHDSVEIELPRYDLTFTFDPRSTACLQSRNWQGLVVDSDQSPGAMFGLSARLMLANNSSSLPERHLVIPIGKVTVTSSSFHVVVAIDTLSDTRVKYHKYRVDTELGRLQGNVTLKSKLYQIYLHALTSYCLPDPLTNRTGTEEAVLELQSARCFSFQKLDTECIQLLKEISHLTPRRAYYPEHRRVMQTIQWSKTGFISQHARFRDLARTIICHAERLATVFAGENQKSIAEAVATLSIAEREEHLTRRSMQRNMTVYNQVISQPADSRGANDAVYCSRESPSDDDREQAVTSVASLIHRRPSRLPVFQNILEEVTSWRSSLSPARTTLNVAYSSEWFSPDLPRIWLSLYHWCRSSDPRSFWSNMIFPCSAMIYGKNSTRTRDLIGTMLAFAMHRHVAQFEKSPVPTSPSITFDLSQGFVAREPELLALVRSAAAPFNQLTSCLDLPQGFQEDYAIFLQRRRSHYRMICDAEAHNVVLDLLRQWPRPDPVLLQVAHINTGNVKPRVQTLFRLWNDNRIFCQHTQRVQSGLSFVVQGFTASERYVVPIPSKIPAFKGRRDAPSRINADDLFSRIAPVFTPGVAKPLHLSLSAAATARTYTLPSSGRHIGELVQEFTKPSSSAFRRQYGLRLQASYNALLASYASECIEHVDPETLRTYHSAAQDQYRSVLRDLEAFLDSRNNAEWVLESGGLWPRLSIRDLLGRLSSVSRSRQSTSHEWLVSLQLFAQVLLQLQHARRLLALEESGMSQQLAKELGSEVPWPSSDDTSSSTYIGDWLLVQIDSDFLMRPQQRQIAREMIMPSSGRNTVMQLNMGEGKSAVIAPLVATALADSRKMVRVVVLKALSAQMFHMLVDRLSGMAGRRVFYLPFSRDVKVTLKIAREIRSLYELCAGCQGILVAQPEHILSLKLMSVDLSEGLNGQTREIAQSLLALQSWLDKTSRDVLDESDEMLNVSYQLVYTAGRQRPVEDHPDRWRTIQETFDSVRRRIRFTQERHPAGIEFLPRGLGAFPHIRVLHNEAWRHLADAVADDMLTCEASLRHLPRNVSVAAYRFITCREASEVDDADVLQKHCGLGGENVWKKLLLLRGLIGHGVLGYVLKEKRWRVDYGLDLKRSLLAVPYRAKDVPSLRADFGHPDVAMALTCLSYYYGGLANEQLDTCFELLMHSDEKEATYDGWVTGNAAVHHSIRRLAGVNLEDLHQREHVLFPAFRHCHATIDFYLSQVVFPKDAKEFPNKLSTSAWDLAEIRASVTTGFSGTNDNQDLLPSSILQNDLPEQLSTNAKVLGFLLKPENNVYSCISSESGGPGTTEDYLRFMVKQTPEIRVLLDVGAQMLDKSNLALAKCWLSLATHVQAAVFFSEDDELMVLARNGAVERFVASPFNQQLDQCFVYLDDAHTRGTDLKLPREFRAAVTLGPKVSKDRLLQGCMRMRQLGYGQTVLFLAPQDVDRNIRDVTGVQGDLTTRDILRWAMEQTCTYIEGHVGHWAHQGVSFKQRSGAWQECKRRSQEQGDDAATSGQKALKSAWLSQEARSLEEMYGLTAGQGDVISANDPMFEDENVRARFQLFEVKSLRDPRVDEEQEREVSQEMEQEREVERPPAVRPVQHQVLPGMKHFVKYGVIAGTHVSAFVPLFSSAQGLPGYPPKGVWSEDLLATVDFTSTIDRLSSAHHAKSEYMEPVQWVLTSTKSGQVVICSPYEVNELLPAIRKGGPVRLHIYSPRIASNMRPLDDLGFFCIPPLRISSLKVPKPLVCQLNIFSGQLYLTNEEMYILLCDFLGICGEHRPDGARVRIDGFIEPEHREGRMKMLSPFTQTPLPFIKELTSVRRKGMSYRSTHMGKVLHSGFLTARDFE